MLAVPPTCIDGGVQGVMMLQNRGVDVIVGCSMHMWSWKYGVRAAE